MTHSNATSNFANLRNVFWSVGCVTLLLVLLVWYGWTGYVHLIVKPPPQLDPLLARVPKRFMIPTLDSVKSGAFQQSVDAAVRDNVPGAGFLISRAIGLKYALHRMALSVFPSKCVLFEPIGERHVIIKDFEMLAKNPELFDESEVSNIHYRVSYYQQLAQRHPNVGIQVCYALPPQSLYLAKFHAVTPLTEVFAGDRYARLFRQALNAEIGFVVAGDDVEPGEAMRLYYKTDHHWNMPGAYHVYRQIYRLIQERNPGLGPLLEATHWHRVSKDVFIGSLARISGAYDFFHDEILDADFGLPAFTSVVVRSKSLAEAQAEPIATSRFANRYADYFGQDCGLLQYENAGGNDRQLLVISDSMDNCLTRLLAAHFARSYFVDPRKYQHDLGEDFDLDAFLLEHPITDLLFVGCEWVIGVHESPLTI